MGENTDRELKTAPSTNNHEFCGSTLREIRERVGLTVEDVSSHTKITGGTIRAIESETFEELPNARIYVWGFVRTLASELELDPEKVAASYLPRWDRWYEDRALDFLRT